MQYSKIVCLFWHEYKTHKFTVQVEYVIPKRKSKVHHRTGHEGD